MNNKYNIINYDIIVKKILIILGIDSTKIRSTYH